MGTLLQDRGWSRARRGECWNIDRPEEIAAIHRAYAEAGGRVLTTNTFGGTRPRLAMHSLDNRVADINREAAAGSPPVAADSAPWWPATSAPRVS